MSLDTPIRASLTQGGSSKSFGFWLGIPNPAVAKVILQASGTGNEGFSWVLVDAEHGLITDADYYPICTSLASSGASPLIRVPWAEEWMIKRALDSGAHGILTPMCHTAADARKIVSYCKYPPTGTRGYGNAFAVHSFPAPGAVASYDKVADRDLVVMVQIESRQGVENVEEIAQVEGLDVTLIGPFDLAKQLNVPHGGEEHEAAIAKILAATKKAGKTAAIFCMSGEQAKMRAEQGFDMISVIPDMVALGGGMARELAAAKGVAGAGAGKGY